MSDRPFRILAILTPRADALETFRQYEIRAAALIARHGGAIEQTILVDGVDAAAPTREVHIIGFPNEAAFRNYRADPKLASLAEMRAASIAETELLIGHVGPDYMALAKAAGI